MARQPPELAEQQRLLGKYLAALRKTAGLYQTDIARAVPCHHERRACGSRLSATGCPLLGNGGSSSGRSRCTDRPLRRPYPSQAGARRSSARAKAGEGSSYGAAVAGVFSASTPQYGR